MFTIWRMRVPGKASREDAGADETVTVSIDGREDPARPACSGRVTPKELWWTRRDCRRSFGALFLPMVTPLVARDTLDVEGLERLVEHILAGGVAGLFVLGTTGEAPSLSYPLRREVIDRVCRQVDGRVPVLVGVTDTSFVESVRLAGHAADAGASAVVLSAPYYFPAGQPELLVVRRRTSWRNSRCRSSCTTCPATRSSPSGRTSSAD